MKRCEASDSDMKRMRNNTTIITVCPLYPGNGGLVKAFTTSTRLAKKQFLLEPNRSLISRNFASKIDPVLPNLDFKNKAVKTNLELIKNEPDVTPMNLK